MMDSIQLIGKLGDEPQYRQFQSGKRGGRFSLALNNYSKKDAGATWVTCGLWGVAVGRL